MEIADLMNVLKFSTADLNANRNGFMSSDQKRRLRRMRLEASILPIVFLVASGALLQVTVRGMPQGAALDTSIFPVVGSSLLLVASIVVLLTRWIRVTADLHGVRVKSVSGPVTLGNVVRNLGYVGEGSTMSVQGIKFIVPFEARKPFLDGKRFRVFYAPSSKIILSAERLRPSPKQVHFGSSQR